MSESVATKGMGGQEELAVRCLQIPLQEYHLLIPNTAVAEVVGFQAPDAAENAPDWFAGMVSWRGKPIPVIRFEPLMGELPALIHDHTRLVILNTISANARVPFIALLANGIPRLRVVKGGEVEEEGAPPEEAAAVALRSVRLANTQMLIPNIAALEGVLERLGVVN